MLLVLLLSFFFLIVVNGFRCRTNTSTTCPKTPNPYQTFFKNHPRLGFSVSKNGALCRYWAGMKRCELNLSSSKGLPKSHALAEPRRTLPGDFGQNAWRIIPVSRWLITMVSKSPKKGYSPSKWAKWLINGGY